MNNILIFLKLVSVFLSVSAKSLNIRPTTCKRSNVYVDQCFVNAINGLLPRIIEGVPKIGIPPLDPLYIRGLEDSCFQKEDPVCIHMVWSDLIIYGISNAVFRAANIDLEKNILSFKMEMPYLMIDAEYNVKGVVYKPVDGEGEVQENLSEVTMECVCYGRRILDNDAGHLHFDKCDFDIKIGTGNIYMENIVRGNETLSLEINEIINENFEKLFYKYVGVINAEFAKIARSIVNAIHENYSIDVLYPQ